MMVSRLPILSGLVIIVCFSSYSAGFPLSDLLGHKGYITPRPINNHAGVYFTTATTGGRNDIASPELETNSGSRVFPARNYNPLQVSVGNFVNDIDSNNARNEHSDYNLIVNAPRIHNNHAVSVVNFLIPNENHIHIGGAIKTNFRHDNKSYRKFHTILKRHADDDDDNDDDDGDDDQDDDHHHGSHLLNHILSQVSSGHVSHDRIARWMSQIEYALSTGSITQAEVNHFLDQLKGTPVGQYLGDTCCLFG